MSTCGNVQQAEIRISGKTLYVPSTEICGRTVVVTGKWIKTAQVKDEELVEGVPVEDPESFITKLKESELKADVFTFAQRPPEITPKYDYHLLQGLVGESTASRIKKECSARCQARSGSEGCTI